MKEIKLTQGKVAIVDDGDFEALNQYKWHAQKTGNGTFYAARGRGGKYVLLHREIMPTVDGMEVDHINGDGLNCQKRNLRNCTRSQNARNSKISSSSTSGFKGASWHKRDKIWTSGIWVNGKQKHLGNFTLLKEAALAYNEAAIKYFGEFARLNTITDKGSI